MNKYNFALIPVLVSFLLFLNSGCSKKDNNINNEKTEISKKDTINKKISDPLNSEKISTEDGLWISFDKNLEKKVSFEKYQGKIVLVKGKFNYGEGYGHFNLWKGEISGITEIIILKNPKLKKYPGVNELLSGPDKYNGKIVRAAGRLIFSMETSKIVSFENDSL